MSDIRTLAVYLGSAGHARPVFQEAAVRMGRAIAAAGRNLVYGGMDAGLMGLLAIEAHKNGAYVTGIVPQNLKDSERILTNLSRTILVRDLWERKRRMFNLADAIIALPGGFGTLDESLEVLYWGHLGLHQKPLVLANIERYWDPVIAFLKQQPDFDSRYLVVVEDIGAIDGALPGWTGPVGAKNPLPAGMKFPHFEDEITAPTDAPIIIDEASVRMAYCAISALGLKQLGKHGRAIGFLNEGGRFDPLLQWIAQAAEERFITPKCLQLFSAAASRESLAALLARQSPVAINLHQEKWGERREIPR